MQNYLLSFALPRTVPVQEFSAGAIQLLPTQCNPSRINFTLSLFCCRKFLVDKSPRRRSLASLHRIISSKFTDIQIIHLAAAIDLVFSKVVSLYNTCSTHSKYLSFHPHLPSCFQTFTLSTIKPNRKPFWTHQEATATIGSTNARVQWITGVHRTFASTVPVSLASRRDRVWGFAKRLIILRGTVRRGVIGRLIPELSQKRRGNSPGFGLLSVSKKNGHYREVYPAFFR